MKTIFPGILFAALWASASAATKFGVQSADPLILATVRFFIAGGLMLTYAYVIKRNNPVPTGIEWRQLTIFALLNTTIYLGSYVLAMKQVSAGIGSLAVATNPLFITLMSAIWLRRPLRWFEGAGLAMGLLGVSVATYPLLQNSYATMPGLLILLAGMIAVSAATVYYARINWRLPDVVINGWQVMLGGLILLPITVLTANVAETHFETRFWLSVGWLIGPVSVAALQLWFYLIRLDAVRASLWLFLCPIFGFIYAYLLLDEPITVYTCMGTAFVIAGLYLGQREKFTSSK